MIIQTTFRAYLISYFPLSCTDINFVIYVHEDNAKVFLIKLIKNPCLLPYSNSQGPCLRI